MHALPYKSFLRTSNDSRYTKGFEIKYIYSQKMDNRYVILYVERQREMIDRYIDR